MERKKARRQRKLKIGSVFLTVSISLGLLNPIRAIAVENGKDAAGNSHVVKVISSFSKSQIRTCSGGVLNEYVVVTAAHCLDDESGLLSKEIWVLPPGALTNRDSSGAYIQDSTWISVDNTQITLTYQNISEKVQDDDLAFLVLSKPIKLEVKTLIPSEDETTRLRTTNASLRLYGYGYSTDSGKISDNPNFYIAQFDSQMSVKIKNSGYATSTEATACQGDSGGPVLSVTPTSVTVVGVITGITTSIRCGKKNSDGKYYTLFTYLSRYANLAFAAASAASKKAALVAQQNKEDAERIATQAATVVTNSKTEIDRVNSELSAAKLSLSIANDKIDELELEIQDLQNQIKILTAKLTITINCVKGNQIKKVTGIEPKCPAGYKKK